MTCLALRPGGAAGLDQIAVLIDPGLTHRMHPMRTASDGIRRSRVAGGAFNQYTNVALQLRVADIVVRVRAGELRMRGAMTRFALEPSVPD